MGSEMCIRDRHHAALRRQMITATVPESLGAVLDNSKHKAFMNMWGKTLLHISRMQQFDIGQALGLPKTDLFTRLAHGFTTRRIAPPTAA